MADGNTVKAGKIAGNPMAGLCDRVCVEVPRVHDGCILKMPSQTYRLTLTDITPGLTYPYTYINAVSVGRARAQNLVATPVDSARMRVNADVVMDVAVSFADSAGRPGGGKSSITIRRDIILNVPARSVFPYSIDFSAAIASEIGTFVNETTVDIVCCVVCISKIIVMSDILVPAYGYCVYPDCTDASPDLCSALMTLPLFPPL
ncbi:MAG: hypothetical protein LBP26_07455 [Clostridiales bacterium]|nr:hypothetical protein [Clostridiales bacterium]